MTDRTWTREQVEKVIDRTRIKTYEEMLEITNAVIAGDNSPIASEEYNLGFKEAYGLVAFTIRSLIERAAL